MTKQDFSHRVASTGNEEVLKFMSEWNIHIPDNFEKIRALVALLSFEKEELDDWECWFAAYLWPEEETSRPMETPKDGE